MRFFVFGDQQGALHSLVRNLAKLKELEVLDENLKIGAWIKVEPDSTTLRSLQCSPLPS
jgi:hypothetical protein